LILNYYLDPSFTSYEIYYSSFKYCPKKEWAPPIIEQSINASQAESDVKKFYKEYLLKAQETKYEAIIHK